MNTFVKILGYIAIGTIAFLLGGYTAQQLWAWFIMPIVSVPMLGFWQAVGFVATVKYFTHVKVWVVEPEPNHQERIIYSLVEPLAVLAIGWLVHSCI